MDDIAPELLEAIKRDFQELLGGAEIQQLDYTGAAEYAERVGAALAEAFRRNLGGDVLPDGRMYWNIADRVVRPMLEQDHRLVSDAAMRAQQALNESAGLGLKTQTAPLESARVGGILNKLASAEHYDDVAWVLDEPVRTFTRAVVDETLRRNVEFQGKAGLAPKIIRRAESHCCAWCSKLEGVYEYPDVPKDVYRRHDNCRCTVEYEPGKGGKRQNVWTRQWKKKEEHDIIEKRKTVGIKQTAVTTNNGSVAAKVKNSELQNGLPISGTPNSIVDKTDDFGKVLQRRVYGEDGMASVDYDTTNHNDPYAHPTGAHRHIFDYSKKHSRQLPSKLTKTELKENEDIIQEGLNYNDQK